MDFSPLRKLLGMIVVTVAMVLLAPAPASAHAGHGQGHAVHAQVSSQTEREAAQTAARTVQALLAAPDHGAAAVQDACVSACCFSMGCCGATLLVEAPRLDPPSGPSFLVPDKPMARPSATVSSLLEPPNARA